MICLCCPIERTNLSFHKLENKTCYEISSHIGDFLSICLEKSVASWIIEPWIMIWTSYTSLHVYQFSGNFLWCQSASIRNPTGWLCVELNCALLSPWLEVLDFIGSFRILHPLDNLGHRYEINVAVIRQDLIDPVKECVKEFGIVLQPCSMEIKT